MADNTAPEGHELEMNHNEHLVAGTEVPGEEHHAEPSALGLAPGGWVGLAMLVFLLILVWKKVPGAITGGLDRKIAEIRHQLDEARALRAEAEALRKEYADKIAGAEKDAAAMIEHARSEADAIVAKAEVDTETVIERRKRMAEDKKIAEIRHQLDEARTLRAEAEALRKEYADKIAGAEKDAAAMIEHARSEADAIVAKAEVDTETVIERRKRMAEDKIAAAQLAAIEDLRATAADAAAKAARGLILDGHDARADKALVDQAIAGI